MTTGIFHICLKRGVAKQQELSKKADLTIDAILADLVERKETGRNNTEEIRQAWKMIIMENFKEVKK